VLPKIHGPVATVSSACCFGVGTLALSLLHHACGQVAIFGVCPAFTPCLSSPPSSIRSTNTVALRFVHPSSVRRLGFSLFSFCFVRPPAGRNHPPPQRGVVAAVARTLEHERPSPRRSREKSKVSPPRRRRLEALGPLSIRRPVPVPPSAGSFTKAQHLRPREKGAHSGQLGHVVSPCPKRPRSRGAPHRRIGGPDVDDGALPPLL